MKADGCRARLGRFRCTDSSHMPGTALFWPSLALLSIVATRASLCPEARRSARHRDAPGMVQVRLRRRPSWWGSDVLVYYKQQRYQLLHILRVASGTACPLVISSVCRGLHHRFLIISPMVRARAPDSTHRKPHDHTHTLRPAYYTTLLIPTRLQ